MESARSLCRIAAYCARRSQPTRAFNARAVAPKSKSRELQDSNVRWTSTEVASSESVTANTSEWDLVVGLCLERKPVVTRDFTTLEKRHQEFLQKFETEHSHKSDHEIRHENDKLLLEKLKTGQSDQASVTTATDYEDACLKELKQFTPASRTTEADEKKDMKSLKRSLDSHLLLAVKQKLGQSSNWMMPHFYHTGESSLKELAEKGLKQTFPNVEAKVLGNAPWGFYKYKYPKKALANIDNNRVGAKVFFYKAKLLSGDVGLPKSKSDAPAEYDDFLWLTRAELPEYFRTEYFDAISNFVIPEFRVR